MDERQALDELRAEVRELREEVRRLRGTQTPRAEERSTRRGVLAMAASGALGATLVAAAPAEAAGTDLVLGSVNNAATAATGLGVAGTSAGYGIGVTDNGLNAAPTVRLPALLGHAKSENFTTGVLGYAEAGLDTSAVAGYNQATGAFGEIGDSSGNGVSGAGGTLGAGVYGQGAAGDGVLGWSGDNGPGVHGVGAVGDNPGMWAEGRTSAAPGLKATSAGGRGVIASGKLAQLQLHPGTQKSHPKQGETGDLFVDKSARLWFCKAGGATATWVRLA